MGTYASEHHAWFWNKIALPSQNFLRPHLIRKVLSNWMDSPTKIYSYAPAMVWKLGLLLVFVIERKHCPIPVAPRDYLHCCSNLTQIRKDISYRDQHCFVEVPHMKLTENSTCGRWHCMIVFGQHWNHLSVSSLKPQNLTFAILDVTVGINLQAVWMSVHMT